MASPCPCLGWQLVLGCPHPNPSSLGSLLSAQATLGGGGRTGALHHLPVPFQSLGCWRWSPARTGGSLWCGARGHRSPRCSTAGPQEIHGISSPSPRRGAPCPLPAGPLSAKSSRSRSSTLVREHASCPPSPLRQAPPVPTVSVSVPPQSGSPLSQSPSASPRAPCPPQPRSVRTRALSSTSSAQVLGSGQHPGCPPVSPSPHCHPSGLPPAAPPGSCFTRARIGGSPGPLSSPAMPLEGPQDTTLLFESRFESGNLQKAVKV